MSPSELVNLYNTDKVQFDFLINTIAQAVELEETGDLAEKKFETKSIESNNMKIIFGERAVALKYANAGVKTRVEASIYFVFDQNKNNRFLLNSEYGDQAAIAVDQYMDKKYGGHNKIL